MSIGDCPNWPDCGHRAKGQCDADADGKRPAVPVWTPTTGEVIPNCLTNSLKRAERAEKPMPFDRSAVFTIWQGMQYQGGIKTEQQAMQFAQQVLAAHGHDASGVNLPDGSQR
jgi:hypothetical protein